MPGESFIENNVEFERKWFRFSHFVWLLLALVLASSISGLSGGGGPLSRRTSKSGGLEVEWERIARARATARLRFVVEAPTGEARIKLENGLATKATLRDITPQPTSVIAGRDSLTLVYEVEPGSAATVHLTEALHKPGMLRSRVVSERGSVDLEQIVLP